MNKAEWKNWLQTHLKSPELRARLMLNASLAFNLIYALLKLIVGCWYLSWWMIGLGGYYALLAGMRFHLMQNLRRENAASDWKAYRHTAVLLLILTIVIGGIVELTFSLRQTFDYPGILIYAFAAFAFAKIISVSISLIRKRHEENRTLAAARCVSFAHALLSILALQVALIHRFGSDSPNFTLIMNSLLGGVTCALIVGIAVRMLWKAGKAVNLEKEGIL